MSVIDLTTDEPPDKFAMVVDLPSDEEDSETDVVKKSLRIIIGTMMGTTMQMATMQLVMMLKKKSTHNLSGIFSKYIGYPSALTTDDYCLESLP